MRTRDELFRQAQRQVAARRQRAVMQAETARREAFALYPALAAAADARTDAGLALTRAAAAGADLAAARAALADAEARYAAALRQAGFDAAAFAPAYTCPACRDTGVVDGRPCRCVAELVRGLRREEINNASPLKLCGFETFDLTRYPTDYDEELETSLREYMGKILDGCLRYAQSFKPNSRSLLFTGTAGLGKTHLALAIADSVLDQGFDVLYTSSAALVAQLAREHFEHDEDTEWLTACQNADLLILDDLGTEYVNALTISVLYELVNTRMLCRRPTIYTSNITDDAVLEARYTEKVSSRILGSCKVLRFYGADQRRPGQNKAKGKGREKGDT